MSYILDALRKSEQERLRGKLPDLNQFGTEDVARTRDRRWVVALVGGLLVVNAAALWIWLSRDDQPVTVQADTKAADAPAQTANANAVSTTQTAPAAAPVGEVSAVGAGGGAAVAASVNSATPQSLPNHAFPAQSLSVQGAAAGATVVAGQGVPAGSVYYVAPGGYVAPAGALGGQPVIIVQAPGTVPPGGVAGAGFVGSGSQPQVPVNTGFNTLANPVIAPGVSANQWPAADTVVPPPPAPPPPPPENSWQEQASLPADPPQVSYLPKLDELPDSLRRQVPDLAFSSHMYSSMAKFRSVVINGTRVREGEWISGQLQVREITESGVILGLGDTVFQVDVLGNWSQ